MSGVWLSHEAVQRPQAVSNASKPRQGREAGLDRRYCFRPSCPQWLRVPGWGSAWKGGSLRDRGTSSLGRLPLWLPPAASHMRPRCSIPPTSVRPCQLSGCAAAGGCCCPVGGAHARQTRGDLKRGGADLLSNPSLCFLFIHVLSTDCIRDRILATRQ